jgi:hypothetical protein
MSEDTTIRVSPELAEELYQRKGRGTSYEDYIWALLDHVDEAEARSGGDTAAGAAETPTSSQPPVIGRNNGTADATPTTDRERLREALAGSGDVLEARVDAVVAMYDRLRQEGEATKGELLDVVDADAVNYAGPDSVWSNMVKGKRTLQALPGVEPPPTGRSTWRFEDDE